MNEEEMMRLEALAATAPAALRPSSAVTCDCGQRLDAFLQALHDELQSDDRAVLMMELPWGRISLHWNKENRISLHWNKEKK